MKKLTKEEFIEKAKKIHGSKYDYSKVNYINSRTKVCIICPKHGEFWQMPYNHLLGKGCQKCGRELINAKNTSNTIEFIEKAKKIHGSKYDYSKVEYVNNSTNVCIICPEHGEFWQTPSTHLNGGGCPKCGFQRTKEKESMTTEEFIEKAKKIHGSKYDYSKVNYVNSNTKVCIICPKHGEFWQTPGNHLGGKGCSKCGRESINAKNTSNTIEFIEKARKIHNDKYDYSKVEYVKAKKKVCIICPEHGEFWQTPCNHLSGYGCPECFKGKSSKEVKLKDMLNNDFKDYEIIYQARPNWLERQTLDFYFPKYKIGIEYQGEQHYYPVKIFGGEANLKKNLHYDIMKNNKCKKNGCEIIYFSFKKHSAMKKYPYPIITNYDFLKNKIQEIINGRKINIH